MKKSIILAIAAAVILGGIYAAIADEQKAAAPQPTATAPAAKTAEAAKPAATTTEATATKPAATTEAAKPAPAPTTTGTAATAGSTTPGTTTTTAALSKQEVRFNVKGLNNKQAADSLKTDLSKANGVFMVNVDQLTGNVTAQIDSSKTTADKLCNWVKTNKPAYTCTMAK